jgi:hypothetical protein
MASSGIATGDWNADGRADFAVSFSTQQGGNAPVVLPYWNGGNKGFIAGSPVAIDGFYGATSMLARDLDGDGRLDLLAATSYGLVDLLKGDGKGGFAVGIVPNVMPGQAAQAGDFNGDGRVDLLGINRLQANPEYDAIFGLGDGRFTFGSRNVDGPGQGDTQFLVADWNGDKRLDFVTVTPDQVRFWAGRGDGSFAVPMGARGYGSDVILLRGDVDRDGRPDLVAVHRGGPLAVYRGGGDGTFGPPAYYPTGRDILFTALGDWTGNGRLDVAYADYWNNVLVLRANKGDGTFGPPSQLGLGCKFPGPVASGDLNGDGMLDLVCTCAEPGESIILLGGKKGFGPPIVQKGLGGWSPLIADLNGDGRADFAASVGATIAVSVGVGDGTFAAPVSIAAPNQPVHLFATDVDGDGRLDLIAQGTPFPMMALYLNRTP